jgi:hypothetical protein
MFVQLTFAIFSQPTSSVLNVPNVFLVYLKCMLQPIPVPYCFSLHQIQVRYQTLLLVPIHQASFDHESERPSARCWGWGKGRLGTDLLFLPKIAQVLVKWSQRAHSWNKWSCKLYLEGKVQREHFFKNKALRILYS